MSETVTETQVRVGQPSSRSPRSNAERATLTVVLLILGVVVGALIWSSLRVGEAEATFAVEVDVAAIESRAGSFYVPLRIENTGKATAEDVVVRAAIKQGNHAVEEAELTFAFIAGGEAEEGVVVFKEDPAQGTIEAGVTSYLRP